MIRKFIMALFAAALFGSGASAQQDKTAEINKIKKNRNYLYATGTSKTSETEASENARIMLAAEIERWLSENSKEDVTGYVAKSKENIALIGTQYGSIYRTFAYVKKKDVLPFYQDETAVTDMTITKEEPGQVIDVVEVQSAEDVQSLSYSDNSSSEVSITVSGGEDATQEEVASVETVKVEEVVPERQPTVQTVQEIPVERLAASNNEVESATVSGGAADIVEERKIIKLNSTSAAVEYLNGVKRDGRLAGNGNASNIPTQGTAYLLLADYHGVIRKYIRVVDGVCTDMLKGETVNVNSVLSEYQTGYSIWFSFK